MNTRLALITGGTKGLGSVLVQKFWDAGYSVAVVARNDTDISSIFNNLKNSRNQVALPLPCDLRHDEEIDNLISNARSILPRLDVLVNNAAIQGAIGPLVENDMTLWRDAIQVNLLAPVALCKGLIPLMAEVGNSSVINISGGGATAPRPNFSAYASSKAALVRFSETIAEEVAPLGIRVNCIAPGAMKTAMMAEVISMGPFAGEREISLAKKVVTDGGTPLEQVADLALFLASNASDGITGKLISAVWDNWEIFASHIGELKNSDIFSLRRIIGSDRGINWSDK